MWLTVASGCGCALARGRRRRWGCPSPRRFDGFPRNSENFSVPSRDKRLSQFRSHSMEPSLKTPWGWFRPVRSPLDPSFVQAWALIVGGLKETSTSILCFLIIISRCSLIKSFFSWFLVTAWDLLDIEDLIDVCASKAMAWVFIMGSHETLLVLISSVQSFGDFFFLFDLICFPSQTHWEVRQWKEFSKSCWSWKKS